MGVTTKRVWGLWSPVLSGVLFDTDKKPYVKEIKKNSGEQSQSQWPCGDAMMVYSFACGAISTEIKWSPVALFLGSVSDPIFLSHSHLSFNWSGFFSILHLIYISCFIMSPELRRGELNLQLIFNYFQNQWHPGSLHSDLLIIFFLVWNKFSPNNS